MLYSGHNTNPAFDLHYSWTGWPRQGTRLPPEPDAHVFARLAQAWSGDGLTVESRAWTPQKAQFTFAATPAVNPVLLAARAKGRLQHALREAGAPARLSRKVSVRAMGHNVTETVINYVRDQLAHVELADARYRDLLARHAIDEPDVDLSRPSETDSGRYWYNLHVVTVTASRYRVGGAGFLSGLRQAVLATAKQGGHEVKAVAIMPDHVHAALRGNVTVSPADAAVGLQNATARVAGCRLWADRYYVGTFGEYDLRAIDVA